MEFRVNMGPNTTCGHGYGPMIIEFEEGHKIEIHSPMTEVTGTLTGARGFNLYDKLTVKDVKNELYCEIVFNPNRKTGLKSYIPFMGKSKAQNKRGDYIEGVISTKDNIDYQNKKSTLVQGFDYLCKVHGNWTQEFYIDDELYWHIDEHEGFRLRDINTPLPSDCRYREDLIYLAKDEEETA